MFYLLFVNNIKVLLIWNGSSGGTHAG